MRPTATTTGSSLGWRPVVVVGLSAAPALAGSICGALVARQARQARNGPRPYSDAFVADGTIGPEGLPPVRVTWLGDSLAAGLGVDAVDDTPARMVARFLERRVELTVLAVPGATSSDVLEHQLPRLDPSVDLVVLCVGANDVASRTSRGSYAARIDAILAAVAPRPTVMLSLPDMAMADRMAQPLRSVAGARCRWFEAARARVVRRHAHAISVDVATRPADLSRRAGREMLCADRFHPGPEAYRIWAERIADACHGLLSPPLPSVAPIG